MGNSQAENRSEFIESESLTWPDFITQLKANENMFAVLDACDEPLIPPKVNKLGERAESLYHGNAARDYSALAPYLVQLDSELADWILQELGERAWGFFVWANPESTLAEVRRHFRKFLMVKGPEDEEFYFRFYDPRLLPNFLSSLTENEVVEFFGPCRSFAVLSGSQVRIFKPCNVQAKSK